MTELRKLLDDANVSYYWLGFLSADGTFNSKRLRLVLAKKDAEHVVRFCNYINCENHQPDEKGYRMSIQDRELIPQIMERFDLHVGKTYRPPDINWMEGDRFLSFFIGYVDGDGCIRRQHSRTDCCLSIKVHSAWLKTLQSMVDKLGDIAGVACPSVRVDKRGYAVCDIANSVVLKFLKSKTRKLELPVLARKWDRIDENFVSRQEQAILNRQKVLAIANYPVSEIVAKTGLGKGVVYKILRLYNRPDSLYNQSQRIESRVCHNGVAS